MLSCNYYSHKAEKHVPKQRGKSQSQRQLHHSLRTLPQQQDEFVNAKYFVHEMYRMIYPPNPVVCLLIKERFDALWLLPWLLEDVRRW
jgi:hypothetical protein